MRPSKKEFEKKRAKHEKKLGKNYFTRQLVNKRYHAWRHERNGAKSEKYKRKIERGRKKYEKYTSKIKQLKKEMNHSAIDELLEIEKDISPEDMEFLYYLFDDVPDDELDADKEEDEYDEDEDEDEESEESESEESENDESDPESAMHY